MDVVSERPTIEVMAAMLMDKLASRNATIGVIGMGYVGRSRAEGGFHG